MNTLSNLKMPRAVCCGEGALKKMPEILQAASVKKAAVFTDKGIRSAGLLDPVLEQLQKSQAAFCVLDDLPPEPSYGQVQKLVDACRAEGADMILAVGYRVRSNVGIHFRRWASNVLTEYMKKGFVLNDERLRNPR